MSEKPILFNTEMVRAILDGRKSCTRRVVKKAIPFNESANCWNILKNGEWSGPVPKCKLIEQCAPYQVGDILYVRETVWQKVGHYLDVDGETKTIWLNEFRYVSTDKEPYVGWNYSWGKRPSIHMPKAAARIWLKVTDARVERLQDITTAGAMLEGVYPSSCRECNAPFGCDMCPDEGYSEIDSFIEIWNGTIKKSDLDRYGWDANPWVWVIEFERCEKPGKR